MRAVPGRRLRFAAVLVVLAAAVALLWAIPKRRVVSSDPTAGTALRANVLLVTIDTLRADRVGRGLTPAFDSLAARGLVMAAARTTAPLTLPAHVSLMTGLFPPEHGVRQNGTYRFDGSHPTLARLLRDAGYQTAAFIGAHVLDRRFGLNDGFLLYDDLIQRAPDAVQRLEAERPGNVVVDRAIAWLRSLDAGGRAAAPFFAWVHLYDPHAPYTPPREFLQKAHGQAYDGEVAFADAQLARLLALLQATGRTGHTIVVVAGDHGESLGEHGEQTHGMLLFDATLRVPLVFAGPGIDHAVRGEPTSLVDVAPTVLQLLGHAVPDGMKGSVLTNGTAPRRADVYSETEYPRIAGWSAVSSVVDERWKLMQSSVTRLFDLEADPGEQADVSAGHQNIIRTLGGRVAAIRNTANASTAQRARLPAGAIERLRSLGYVASRADASSDSSNEGDRAAPDPASVIGTWTAFEAAESAAVAHDYAQALPVLKQLAADNPAAAVFEASYVQALQESGDARGAVETARRAVARHPRDATLFHALAVAARDAHLADEALRAEAAALAIDPADPAVQNGMGLLYVDGARFPDAAAAFQRAVELDATNAQYWTNLGNALRETSAPAGAETAYRRALDIDATAADAANGLGVLLVQGGRPADAIPWFERALAHTSGFYEAQLNLGIACQQAGNTGCAAQAYREVLKAPARFAREREGARKLLDSLAGKQAP